jgi:hypothetical protein
LKKKYSFLLLIITSLSINLIYSQRVDKSVDSSKVYTFSGKVIDDENVPVVFAHVVNKKRGLATITDSTGYFRIMAVNKDSIRISAIGFYTKSIFINFSNKKDTALQIIKMTKKTYEIATVNIYELRWQVFKSEFMEQKVEEDKTAVRITNWMANLLPAGELTRIYQSTMAPGFAINWKTKADKSRKKVAEMEKKYQLIAPKFNDKMVTEITGLKGQEIYDFMQFCNFKEDFIIQATEYELMEEILRLWKEYHKQNQFKNKNH